MELARWIGLAVVQRARANYEQAVRLFLEQKGDVGSDISVPQSRFATLQKEIGAAFWMAP